MIYKKLDQYTGGKCLIHGTKHYKDNQLQSLKHPYPIWEWKLIQGSSMITDWIQYS